MTLLKAQGTCALQAAAQPLPEQGSSMYIVERYKFLWCKCFYNGFNT